MPAATTTGSVEVEGASLYYAIYGTPTEAAPLLLIHGGLGHADVWSQQVLDLMADHQIIVADTRGHGRSTYDDCPFSYDLLADDYIAILDELGVDQVHLIGWSDGANIGFVLSNSAPERLASHFAHAGNVSLEGVNPGTGTDPTFGNYIGMMGKQYAQYSATPDGYEAFLGAVAQMWGTEKPGGLEALSSVEVPTTVVHSEFDEAILASHAAEIDKTLLRSRLITLYGVSHFALMQNPTGYTEAVRSHLDWAAGQ